MSDRAATAASVSWSPVSWASAGLSGGDQRSTDLRAIIQEIVDRGDWSSGNAMVLVIRGTGSRVAESHNGSATQAPQLVVTYQSAPAQVIDLSHVNDSVTAPVELVAGESFEFGAEVANGGTDPSGAFEIELYLSTDTVIENTDELLGLARIDTVGAGGSVVYSIASTVPAGMAEGTYYLGIRIDGAEEIAETDEGNNTWNHPTL